MANVVKWSIDVSGTIKDVDDFLKSTTAQNGLSKDKPITDKNDPNYESPANLSPFERVTADDEKEFDRVRKFLRAELPFCESPKVGVYARQVYNDEEPRHGIGLQLNISEYW